MPYFKGSSFFLLCYFSAPLKPQLFSCLFRSGRELLTAIQQYLPNQLPKSSCSSLSAVHPSSRLHGHALSAQEIPLKRGGFTLRIASWKIRMLLDYYFYLGSESKLDTLGQNLNTPLSLYAAPQIAGTCGDFQIIFLSAEKQLQQRPYMGKRRGFGIRLIPLWGVSGRCVLLTVCTWF